MHEQQQIFNNNEYIEAKTIRIYNSLIIKFN